MKSLFFSCLLLCTTIGFAQNTASKSNPLIGTWIETTDTLEEIKIFSPTHFIFYVRNTKRDTFSHAGAGAYTMTKDKYTEHYEHADFEVQGGKAQFNYRVQGDTFYQNGELVLQDDTKYVIHHTFLKVKDSKSYPGAHVSTWNQLSSSFTNGDGSISSHTNATHIRYQIITPTHWMRISKANGRFENAFGGTYTMEGGKMLLKVDYSSVPSLKGVTVDVTQRIEGNRLYWQGTPRNASGKEIGRFEDVFERVDNKNESTALK